MPAAPRNPIVALKEVVERAKRLVQLEVELRVLELRGRAVKLGLAAALGLVAVLLVPLLVVFLLAAAAAALATTMAVWLAILIVGAVLLLVIVVLAGAGVRLARGAMRQPGGDDGGA